MSHTFSLPPDVKRAIQDCRKKNGRLVLATGVFDLLHQEHINFLASAKETGDCLLVGVETDARVKKLKGEGRPIENQAKRMRNVQKLGLAEAVFLLPQEFSTKKDHLNLIKLIQPKILAVSAHSPHLEQKKKIMQMVGGELKIVHPHNPDVSTSLIINSRLQS